MYMDTKVGGIMSKQFYKEELGNMIAENSKLKKIVLDLTMENAELKDRVLELGGDETGQLDLFDVSK